MNLTLLLFSIAHKSYINKGEITEQNATMLFITDGEDDNKAINR